MRRLADLASRAPDQRLSAHARWDPYWDDDNGSLISAAPVHDQDLRRWLGRGWGTVESLTCKEALERLLRPNHSRTPYRFSDHLAPLGAVHSWHHGTAQQLAAFAGNPRLLTGQAFPLLLAIRAGAMQLHAVQQPYARRALWPVVFSLREDPRVQKAIEQRLTPLEEFAVTGGGQWAGGRTHVRHNVLATELGLRASEYLPDVVAVMGERYSGLDALAGSGVGLEPISTTRAADMTLVCSNGMRIAVEVTATAGENIQAKVDHWFETLDHPTRTFAATGLVVIFLLTPKPGEQHNDASYDVHRKIYAAVLAAARRHPFSGGVPTRFRVGVADWREWFPAPGLASEAFLRLRADRPAKLWSDGPVVDGYRKPSEYSEVWEPADFLRGAGGPIAGADTALLLSGVERSRWLGQTPHWDRDLLDVEAHEQDQLSSTGITCDGVSRLAPGVGAARDTRLSRRLLGLGGYVKSVAPDLPVGTSANRRSGPRPRIGTAVIERAAGIAPESVASAHRALLEVTYGRVAPWQLIQVASLDSTSPLRAITLEQLLLAEGAATPRGVEAHLRRLAVAIDKDPTYVRQRDIGWLVHANSGGRRMAAWRAVSARGCRSDPFLL